MKVNDLRPVMGTHILSDESDSEDSKRLIYLNSDPLDSDSDSNNLLTAKVAIENRPSDETTRQSATCFEEVPDKADTTPMPCF